MVFDMHACFLKNYFKTVNFNLFRNKEVLCYFGELWIDEGIIYFLFFFFILFSRVRPIGESTVLIIQSSWRQWTPAEPIKSNRMQIDCIPSSEERLTFPPFSSPSTGILPKIHGTNFHFISWNYPVKKPWLFHFSYKNYSYFKFKNLKSNWHQIIITLQ